mgnify:CR=1 FL=1
MYQLKIGTIPLPKLYVCENRNDAAECRKRGIPYLIKPATWTNEKLIKAILWRTLTEKFPHIEWTEILGYKPKQLKVHVTKVSSDCRTNSGMDTCGSSNLDKEVTINDEYREVDGGIDINNTFNDVMNDPEYTELGVDDYIGDLGWCVKIEELQALKLLPEFLGDITNAIKTNISNSMWMDGYNKKLDAPVGMFQGSEQAPNLIILDTSGSIPSGVAGTMISLIDTLRSQANADLIITSGRSEYWPANTDLPSPDDLAYLIGGCNECVQFYNILRTKILGKHWGNVIIFGDNDSPLRNDIAERSTVEPLAKQELQSTHINRIMAFHTYIKRVPGYGLWAEDAAPKAEIVYNTDWVSSMKKGY